MSHIYIIYIYISVQHLSLGDPQRHKKPLKNGVLVNFPFQLRVLGWRSGFPNCPNGLSALWPECVPSAPLLTGSVALLGKPRQKGEDQGFGVVGRPCDVQVAAPSFAKPPWTAQQKADPTTLAKGSGRTTGISPGPH